MNNQPLMTRFVFGEDSFISTGVSEIVITDKGVKKLVYLPIKSIGVIEAQELLMNTVPKPPTTIETAVDEATGDERKRIIEDRTNEAFVEQYSRWQDDIAWHTVATGLDIEFVSTDGKAVTEIQEIIAGLKASGITSQHLNKIYSDITLLTRHNEGVADFLSEDGLGSPKPSSRKSRRGTGVAKQQAGNIARHKQPQP